MRESAANEVRLPDGAGGALSARVHLPSAGLAAPPTLLVTHGAGGDLNTPGLVTLAEALAPRGIRTIRFNLPAAEAGRRRPDRPAAATRAIAAAAEWTAREHGRPLFLGGRSFGGRMASLLLADETSPIRGRIAGLVLLAYPLKPPAKTEVPPERREHLGRIGAPTLFVSGDRDPFAPPALLNPVASAAGAEVRWIAGGDHGFRVPKAILRDTERTAAAVREEIAQAVAAFIAATATDGPLDVG